MPELPEVETICRGLDHVLQGAKILRVEQRRADLRFLLPEKLAERLTGRRVVGIRRRAKYIMIELDDGNVILLHLGMSGRLVVGVPETPPAKHDHVILHCDHDRTVCFNDPRRFGMLDLLPAVDLPQHRLLKHLGVEPLGGDLTPAYLAAKFHGRKTSIKAALLDQRLIAGLGNIYVSEALYYAGVLPLRRAGSLKPKEIAALVPAIRKVLKAAIEAGGSSLRDYVQSDGTQGYFQTKFAVYDRTGRSCPGCACGKPAIMRIVQNGHATFFCPAKQK